MIKLRNAVIAIPASAALLLLAGCAGSGTTDPDASASGDRVLKVATITGALPYQSLDDDGKTVIGYEPDLVRAAAERIGATVEFTILDFDALLPGVDSGRFDLVMSGFSDKPERQQKYDMLDVADDKFTFGGLPEVASTIKTPMDVCGHSTGAVPGGAYVEVFAKWSDECVAAGKEPITVQTYDGDSQGFLSVKSGQTDFWPSSVPIIADWAAKNDGAVTPLTFLENPSAFIFPKDSELTKEMQSAIQGMVDDGSYQEILEKWNVQDIARDEITINAGKAVTE